LSSGIWEIFYYGVLNNQNIPLLSYPPGVCEVFILLTTSVLLLFLPFGYLWPDPNQPFSLYHQLKTTAD
jgi:hypothetical protein